jgi:sporulation protein YlmC with PRC-barrel domain
VVEPHEGDLAPSQSSYDTDEDGHFRVPVGRVQAVKDYIVVQR